MTEDIEKDLETLKPSEVATKYGLSLKDLWKNIYQEYGVTSIHDRHKLPRHIRVNTFGQSKKSKSYEELKSLRNEGWTFQKLGDRYGFTRQRAERIYKS